MWERGLKLVSEAVALNEFRSLPMWERGLKLFSLQSNLYRLAVAPHVGAWIETSAREKDPYEPLTVAPHVGAWIETKKCERTNDHQEVAPHVGAWIETRPSRLRL